MIAEQVATKQDVKDLGTELCTEIAELRAEIAVLRTEMRTEFAAIRAEMAAGFRDVEQRITIRLGGMLVVLAGILLAAKFFG